MGRGREFRRTSVGVPIETKHTARSSLCKSKTSAKPQCMATGQHGREAHAMRRQQQVHQRGTQRDIALECRNVAVWDGSSLTTASTISGARKPF